LCAIREPLRLTISNKQQIINKTALIALAILVVSRLVSVEGQDTKSIIWDLNKTASYRECANTCDFIKSLDSKARDVLIDCYTFCNVKFPL
jgi:hypothetical protein